MARVRTRARARVTVRVRVTVTVTVRIRKRVVGFRVLQGRWLWHGKVVSYASATYGHVSA